MLSDFEVEMNEVAEEILGLVKAESDVQTRTTLLVLLKIARAMDANTQAIFRLGQDVEAHTEELRAHKEQFIATSNRRLEARRIFLPLVGIAQTIMLAVLGVAYADYGRLQEKVNNLDKVVATILATK